MIELCHLAKTYKDQDKEIVALEDVNLTIQDGEIYGIIGLSGAGKSTLVRCINLLERPTAGQVIIDGEYITVIPRKRLRTDGLYRPSVDARGNIQHTRVVIIPLIAGQYDRSI